MRKISSFICLLIMLSFNSAIAATPENMFVTKVADEVMQAIKKGGGEVAISSGLQKTFANYVDLPWISNFVLGRHARAATPAQKQLFIASYKDFMIKSYASRLKNYSGETYKITNQQAISTDKSQLRMEVQRKNAAPILIDYKIHKVGSDFKIYDMAVEGISLITTQRAEFDAVIERKGLDELIAALQKSNSQKAKF